MGQATLLRTLTEKSVLKFTKYADVPVGQLLQLNKTKFLRWVYYNCSMITFTEEILYYIHINEDFKINKPGKNAELGIELDDILFKKMPFKDKMHIKKVVKCIKRSKIVSENIGLSRINNKYSLQRKNHGHV